MGEVFCPSDRLCAPLWSCSNRSTSFLFRRPQGHLEYRLQDLAVWWGEIKCFPKYSVSADITFCSVAMLTTVVSDLRLARSAFPQSGPAGGGRAGRRRGKQGAVPPLSAGCRLLGPHKPSRGSSVLEIRVNWSHTWAGTHLEQVVH